MADDGNELVPADPSLPTLDDLSPRCPKCQSTRFVVLDRSLYDRRGHFEECHDCGYVRLLLRLPTR